MKTKRPTLLGYLAFCWKHGLSDWGSYCLMSQFEDLYKGGPSVRGRVGAKTRPPGASAGVRPAPNAGQNIYYWPDGSVRLVPPTIK
jgi:hypothetical protein